jgi:hypothetical protein
MSSSSSGARRPLADNSRKDTWKSANKSEADKLDNSLHMSSSADFEEMLDSMRPASTKSKPQPSKPSSKDVGLDVWGVPRHYEEDDIDGASASVLKSLEADEERLTRELREMPTLGFRSSRSSEKGESARSSPIRKAPVAKSKSHDPSQIGVGSNSTLRSKSAFSAREDGSTNMTGRSLPCAPPSVAPLTSSGLFQERVPLPWEQQTGGGSKYGSDISSTASVGSTSMGTRPQCARSDVSSGTWSAGFSARQGSDVGSPSHAKATVSADSRRKPVKSEGAKGRLPSDRTSALDIAAMCWKEFEGALQP